MFFLVKNKLDCSVYVLFDTPWTLLLCIFFQKKQALSLECKCLLFLDFLFVLSRSLENGQSHRPTKVALFTLLSDLTLKQFFYSFTDYFLRSTYEIF